MIGSIVGDAMEAFRTYWENADKITLLIAAGSALVISLKMDRLHQIGWATLEAFALFVVGSYVYDYLSIAPLRDVSDTERLLDQLRYSWNTYSDLGAGGLTLCAAAFMTAILVFFCIRSVLSRG
ncbi:MAG: hypothetical protein WD076_02880 [Parvularculaceae bacterium]